MSKRKADAEHPFGYGRERYVYAFLVSIILFSVGGLFSISEGIDKIHAPARAQEHLGAARGAACISIVLESFSLRTADPREQPRARARTSRGWRSCGTRRLPSCPSCCSRTSRRSPVSCFALLGVGLDGDHRQLACSTPIGTLLIGCLLVVVAIVLGHRDEEPAGGRRRDDGRPRPHPSPRIEGGPQVERVIHMKTLYLGPEELMVAAKLGFASRPAARATSRATSTRIEARIRAAVPAARVIYLEPDILRAASAPSSPDTEEIVVRSVD